MVTGTVSALGEAVAYARRFSAWNGCARIARRTLPLRLPWLDVVTWRLIGGALGIAVALELPTVPQLLIYGDEWRGVPIYMLVRAIEGLTILFTGALLLHVLDASWWRLVALALAVTMGCLAGAALEVAIVDPGADVYNVPAMPAATAWLYRARGTLADWSFVAAAWYLADRARRRAAVLREEQTIRHSLDTRITEARLQMLEAQVEPHFIFNTLANIKRLCQLDPPRARITVDRFATYLRASLPQMRDAGGTLGREVDLARAYLDVQKVRMGRRLTYALDVDAALRPHPFPRMMLITLVENAIKHGLNPSVEGGAIRIAAGARDGVLHVSVADTGCGFTKTMGSGIGLSNIRSRLAVLHGPRARLALIENEPHGVVASIELPLSEAGDATVVDEGSTA